MAKMGVNEAWRHPLSRPSFSEAHNSIRIPSKSGFWRKLLAFSGPGLLVAVGYMDPGNWATDLEGGARYGYTLLSVILLSNFMAMLLQHLAVKLGVVTGRDLAQACRDHYTKPIAFMLWVLCEVAIVACDLAEVIGSAIALNLLLGWPLVVGVLVTAIDVMFVLLLPSRRFRLVEVLVALLIFVISGCFAYDLWLARPDLGAAVRGLLPSLSMFSDSHQLYLAAGILGATVMPHNLYLHSSLVQTRAYPRDDAGRETAIRYGSIDSTVSLLGAFFVNASILMLSAAAFHGTAHEGLADIGDAYKLLTPALGDPLASLVFAVALLASGQNSTITGTLAGQIVMEGFLDIRLKPWLRRLVTRGLAIVPAVWVAARWGGRGVGDLLVLSQVVLSLQLSFAVIPLVSFTSSGAKMGRFKNSPGLTALSWCVALAIACINLWLLAGVWRR